VGQVKSLGKLHVGPKGTEKCPWLRTFKWPYIESSYLVGEWGC
jgi:hypothetical protein